MISNHDAELMARNDAGKLHESKPESYVQDNRYQYYTLANTWVLLVKPHNAVAATILENYLRSNGLLSAIAEAQCAADAIIRDSHVVNPSFAMMVTGLDHEDALQILRFPKRFSPISEALKKATIEEFKRQLHKVEGINRRKLRVFGKRWMLEAVRDELADMLASYSCNFDDIILTNGSSKYDTILDGHPKSIYDKVYTLHRHSYYNYPYYGTGSVAEISSPNGRTDFGVASLGAVAELSCVPKSYKTYRTIAMESVDKQSDQQCVRRAIEQALDKSVGVHAPIHDQSINGLLASDMNYATVDLHAASDSLSWWLMHEVLPRNVFEDCMYARSAYLLMPDGHCIVNPLFCTMGNGFCFALETSVFLAIIRSAVKSWCNFVEWEFSDDMCWAYGDDLIVIAEAYDYVVWWLESLDFVVNADKSFSTENSFRESCGYDWKDGAYVSSIYWPRKEIQESLDSCLNLCALENRLFERGAGYFYYEAYNFICNQVHRITPKLSEVPLALFLEYNLQGKCLVTHTAPQPETLHYKSEFKAFGTLRVYEEDRLYVNLLQTRPTEGTILYSEWIEHYLYYTFLKDGPMYLDDISRLLGVSTSYFDKSYRLIPGDTVVTRRRLF